MKNSDFPLDIQIMNIAMNMARIGNWIADCYEDKKDLIKKIIQENEHFLFDLQSQSVSKDFKKTLKKFSIEFEHLKKEPITKENRPQWAEKALTWANILQHRVKLA